MHVVRFCMMGLLTVTVEMVVLSHVDCRSIVSQFFVAQKMLDRDKGGLMCGCGGYGKESSNADCLR